MNALDTMMTHELAFRLGWVLLHSLWQVTAVAAVLAVALRALHRASANARYLVSCLSLLVIVAASVATVCLVNPAATSATEEASPEQVGVAGPAFPFESQDTGQPTSLPAMSVVPPALPSDVPTVLADSGAQTKWHAGALTRLEAALPCLAIAWMLGVIALSLWHLGGWAQLQRLKRRLVQPVANELSAQVHRLAEQLHVRQAVTVLQSALVEVPTVIGCLKPVILLPASVLTGLSTDQLEGLLAHELAHIRRHDYLVNLLQAAVEILGFYHPGIWWISRRIRVERENCCDDIASRHVGDRARYAEALATMETLRGSTRLALAASGGSLFARIRRLAAEEPARSARVGLIPAITAGLAIALVGLLSFTQVHVSAADTDSDAVRDETTVPADDAALPPVKSIELAPEQERVIQELALTDPRVIRLARTLSQPWGRLSATEARDGAKALSQNFGEEGKRAAAALVAAPYSYTQELVASYLSSHPDTAELVLQNAVASWDRIYAKSKRRLAPALRTLQEPWGEHAAPSPLVEEVLGLMIKDPGQQVPLLGLELAQSLAPTSELVRAAAESQRDNAEYDYFKNVHPVRWAALEFLGETYVPPKREAVDYAGISIVEAEGLTASSGLTIGNLTSLYSATGPCAGGRDKYGWGGQFRGMQSAQDGDEVVALLHPISTVDDTPVRQRLEKGGRPGVVLNSASPKDLAYCDVVVLSSIYNLRPEVVDALEEYVWNGGGIVTIDGAGIISCDSEDKLAGLLDMPKLSWSWSMIKDQRVVETLANPITKGLNLSKVVRSGAFNRNGYAFYGAANSDQVLLRFEPDGSPALRVSTYGKGRIANIGWSPRVGHSPEVRDFVRRCMAWAGGQIHTDYVPKPVHSQSRYGVVQPPTTLFSPAPMDMVKALQEVQEHYQAAAPDIREYILWTARTFGPSQMWLNENAFEEALPTAREERVEYLSELLTKSEYGRHLCSGLAEASALKDERLVPGLMEVAAFHRPGEDYDCRPKWIAVSALARQESDQSVALLINLVDHGNQNTRMWARAALARKTGRDFKEDKQAWNRWWADEVHDSIRSTSWPVATSAPGDAVQKIFMAIQRGDADTVWQTMSRAEQLQFMADLDVSNEQAAKQVLLEEFAGKPRHRLTIDKVRHDGPVATVTATVYRTPDDTTGEVETIRLIKEANRWVIDNNADTTSRRDVGTEMLTIQVGADEVRSVSVALGLTPRQVTQLLHPAGVLSGDDPMCECRAADGGMYMLYFLPGIRGQPQDDRLAAVAKFSPERPGDASPENRKPGVFLLPADKRGARCPREYHNVKAILESDNAALKLEFRPGSQSPEPGLTAMTLPGSESPVYVSDDVVISNDDIASARVVVEPGGPVIEINFTEAGAARFATATEQNLMKPLAVLVDGRLISAPIVRDTIFGGKAVITADFSEAEAERIARGIAGETVENQEED